MPQYSIHKNVNPATKRFYPHLLNVQSSLLDDLDTRLMIPLVLKSDYQQNPIKDLNPILEMGGDEYIALTQQMAAIHMKNIGPQSEDALKMRREILASIDLLITGF